MTYLLDSNICILYINGRSLTVAHKLKVTPLDQIRICSIVKAELYYGARRSQNPEKTRIGQDAFLSLFHSFPFDDDAAEYYSRIRAELASRGTPIGPNDLMIAAIALANGLVLVTHNTREFSRIDGLHLEDREEPS